MSECKESSMEFTAENLGKFYQWYFSKPQLMRLGQAAVYVFHWNEFTFPKTLRDSIFYEEDQKFVGEKLWNSLFAE